MDRTQLHQVLRHNISAFKVSVVNRKWKIGNCFSGSSCWSTPRFPCESCGRFDVFFLHFDRYACEQSPKRLVQLIKEAEEDAKIMKEHFQLDKDGDGDPSMEEKKAVVIQYLQRKNMRFHRTFERLGFLYYAYHENQWWYEIVELSRKLILNGIIVLIPEAVTARVMVGLLTCLMYCIVVSPVPSFYPMYFFRAW